MKVTMGMGRKAGEGLLSATAGFLLGRGTNLNDVLPHCVLLLLEEPGQVEQGLCGVVTRTGTAFIEDQIVLLESQSRENKQRELKEMGNGRKLRRAPSASTYSLCLLS